MKPFLLLTLLPLAACGESPVSISGDTVTVNTADFDVTFTRTEDWSAGVMVFGGMHKNVKNLIARTVIAGLHLEDARLIAESHPTFHMCSSPGAAEAKDRIDQLNLVAADSSISAQLAGVMKAHNANVKNGGDRICVELSGAVLEVDSILHRETQMDMKSKFPEMDYYLVTSVALIEAKEALKGE